MIEIWESRGYGTTRSYNVKQTMCGNEDKTLQWAGHVIRMNNDRPKREIRLVSTGIRPLRIPWKWIEVKKDLKKLEPCATG